MLNTVAKPYKQYPLAAAAWWCPVKGLQRLREFIEETGLYDYSKDNRGLDAPLNPAAFAEGLVELAPEWAEAKELCAFLLNHYVLREELIMAARATDPADAAEKDWPGAFASRGTGIDAVFWQWLGFLPTSTIPVERLINAIKNKAHGRGVGVQGERRTLIKAGGGFDVGPVSKGAWALAAAKSRAYTGSKIENFAREVFVSGLRESAERKREKRLEAAQQATRKAKKAVTAAEKKLKKAEAAIKAAAEAKQRAKEELEQAQEAAAVAAAATTSQQQQQRATQPKRRGQKTKETENKRMRIS